MKTFSGIPDVDYEILSQLNDVDLVKICSLNTYTRKLCQNENFWRNRTIKRFGKYLGSMEQIRLYKDIFSREIKKEITWKEYYISIVDFLEKVYLTARKVNTSREDLKILYNQIQENSERLWELFFDDEINVSDVPEYIAKEDLINPNVILRIYSSYFNFRIDILSELLDIFIASQAKDRRINLSYDNNYLLNELLTLYKINVEDQLLIYSMIEKVVRRIEINPTLLKNIFNKKNLDEKILQLIFDYTNINSLYEVLKEGINFMDDKYLQFVLYYLTEKDSFENVQLFLKSIPLIMSRKIFLQDYLGKEFFISEIEKLFHTRKYSIKELVKVYKFLNE